MVGGAGFCRERGGPVQMDSTPRAASPEQVLCASHLIISGMLWRGWGWGDCSNPVVGIRKVCLNPGKVTQFGRRAGNWSATRAYAHPLGGSACPSELRFPPL